MAIISSTQYLVERGKYKGTVRKRPKSVNRMFIPKSQRPRLIGQESFSKTRLDIKLRIYEGTDLKVIEVKKPTWWSKKWRRLYKIAPK